MSVAGETVVFHRSGTAVAQANAILDPVPGPAAPRLAEQLGECACQSSGIKRRLVLTWFRAR